MGPDDAKMVVKAFETTISDITEYKWRTSKDELLSEMERRFATKADLALQEAKINARIDKLEFKMLLYFLVLIFALILTNSKSLDLLYKLLGLVK
ncbi:MAG: hypothetical protein SFH39_14705 [Candidatus Magnetobacterium sp. LHC-1]|nr:hypothetical protein [Nitrospirota bacterium]